MRSIFELTKIKRKELVRFSVAVVVAFLLPGTATLAVVQAAPPAQDPRPPVDGGGGDGGGGTSGGVDGGDSDQAGSRCASLVGQVINWGFGNQSGVTTELSTGSWQASTISSSDGHYGFGGLGVGIAVLHVSLTPEQAEGLQPLIQDAGVYLNCNFPTIANVALFSGSPVKPPATIQMSAPGRLRPGRNTPVRLTIKNGLPNEITNVIVTNLMPPGLVALDVATAAASSQEARIIDAGDDGQLVVVHLDKVAAGDEINIIITVTTAGDVLAGTQIRNTATLFYRESAADQAEHDFTIGSGGLVASATPTVPAPLVEATPVPEPQPSPTPPPVATPLSSPPPPVEDEPGEEFVPPGDLPTTGDAFVPPDILPVTGEGAVQPPNSLPDTGLGIILPLSWLGLIGLAFLARRRRWLDRKE